MTVLRRGPSASAEPDGAVLTASAEYTSTSPATVSPAWHRQGADFSISPPSSFADIVRDELLQTATSEHIANKSLALIQVAATGSSNASCLF